MKKITYSGLGFPIILEGVKTREFRGEILPDINHRELEDLVFKTLLWLPAHFSGAHLSFIRSYMGLSQKEFATMLGLKTHATISGWELKGNKATGMLGTTEVVVRLLMAKMIEENFAEHFREFLEIPAPLKNLELKVS
jgi:DNA-binding transcriptional regulator YiaG